MEEIEVCGIEEIEGCGIEEIEVCGRYRRYAKEVREEWKIVKGKKQERRMAR